MKKTKVAFSFFMGIIISFVLFIDPITSCATSTTMTLTFSDQKRENEVAPTTDFPLITQTKEKKGDKASLLVHSDQRRLPTTGEEYNPVLSCLGWATFLCILLFFFIGNYEWKGRDSRE